MLVSGLLTRTSAIILLMTLVGRLYGGGRGCSSDGERRQATDGRQRRHETLGCHHVLLRVVLERVLEELYWSVLNADAD